MPLWKEAQSLDAPSDASFMNRLERMTAHSLLPPLSLVVMRPSQNGSDKVFCGCIWWWLTFIDTGLRATEDWAMYGTIWLMLLLILYTHVLLRLNHEEGLPQRSVFVWLRTRQQCLPPLFAAPRSVSAGVVRVDLHG